MASMSGGAKVALVACRVRTGLVLAALAACGRHESTTQSFTRQVPASMPVIVRSAVTTFSNHGFTVEVADEPGGLVRTAPLDLHGALPSGSPEDRVACAVPAGDTTAARDSTPVTVSFEVTVKSVSGGSVVMLSARQEHTGGGCAVKSAFVAQLLDEITQGARQS